MKISLFGSVCLLLVLNALGSVAVADVPLSWVALAGMIPAGLIFCGRVHGMGRFYLTVALLLAWAACLNLAHWSEFQVALPLEATSSYGVFVLLRYLTILSFVSSVIVTVRLCQTGYERKLVAFLVRLGAVISVYAIYVYVAQLYELPELLPRSRLGTGGEEQSVTFSYAFHRAMGSFREPSHLAEWLMLPFVLSFVYKRNYVEPYKLVIGASILLTGSMTGIMSLLIGLGVAYAVAFLRPQRVRFTARIVGRALGALVLGGVLLYGMDQALSGLLIETVEARTMEIVEGGMMESNRSSVYRYVAETPIPLAGSGLGNANIQFSSASSTELITSFLSLYLNAIYSVGPVGFFLLAILLGYPLYRCYRVGVDAQRISSFALVWGYAAWLVAFSVHSEELSLMFGVIYGLLSFRLLALYAGGRAPAPAARPRPA